MHNSFIAREQCQRNLHYKGFNTAHLMCLTYIHCIVLEMDDVQRDCEMHHPLLKRESQRVELVGTNEITSQPLMI